MKIYIKNNTINRYNIDKIQPIDTYSNNLFYTENGIFKINNNGYFNRLEIIDKETLQMEKDDLSIIMDESYTITKPDICYQLPKNHIHDSYTTNYYKLTEKSPLKLCVNLDDDNIKDWYFESKEHPENIIADINKFLSIIT